MKNSKKSKGKWILIKEKRNTKLPKTPKGKENKNSEHLVLGKSSPNNNNNREEGEVEFILLIKVYYSFFNFRKKN